MELIGYLAAILVTGTAMPQVYKYLKTKNTRDLSMISLIMRLTGTALWEIYAIYHDIFPIILGNLVIMTNYSILIYLKQKYK